MPPWGLKGEQKGHGGHRGHRHCSSTVIRLPLDVWTPFLLIGQGLSKAVLIGHSMGGKAAAMTALLHPEIVRGLMVLDIAPVSYPM